MYWAGFNQGLRDDSYSCKWELDVDNRLSISRNEIDAIPIAELESFFLKKKKEAAFKMLAAIFEVLEKDVPLPGEEFDTELSQGDFQTVHNIRQTRQAAAMNWGAPPPDPRALANAYPAQFIALNTDQGVANRVITLRGPRRAFIEYLPNEVRDNA